MSKFIIVTELPNEIDLLNAECALCHNHDSCYMLCAKKPNHDALSFVMLVCQHCIDRDDLIFEYLTSQIDALILRTEFLKSVRDNILNEAGEV